MNKTNDFKYNLPAYSDPVDIEDLNDNFRGIDDALMAGLCKKDYTGNNMGSSDPSARKYAWAPWFEIVNDNEFDVVVTDRNAPVESEEATINIAAGQTFRKYINGRYYMNFYVQDQHDVTFKWFTNAETYINESGGGGGGTGTVTSVSVQGGSGSHLTGSGNPIETSGTITINVDEGYSIPSDNEQDAWDGKAADLKAEIDSSTYVLTLQLKDSSGNLIGTAKTIDLPLETMVVDGEYDSQTKKIKLELKNGNYVEFSVADLVSGLQTELSASNKLDPDYIDYDSSHRAVSDTEKGTWDGKQNAISDLATIRSGAAAGATAVQPSAMQTALDEKQDLIDNSHKLSSDLVDDTNKTNKFVTSAEKSNWNAKGTYSKPQDGIPKTDLESAVQTSLGLADSALQSETDPTVPSWAKQTNPPTYTASDVGAIATTAKGTYNGVAELDANGKVPSSQLPSYVDDVLEYSAKSSFPATGETGKIYVDTATNLTYRWSGTAYVEISPSIALGETSSTAYRGDRGKDAYDHSQVTSGNPHNVTKTDVGLGNVGNFKAVSTVASQGLNDTEKSNARANIGAGTSSFSGSYSDLSNKPTSMTPTSHTHGNIQNGGTLQTNDITIASGDKLIVADSSDSSKIARTSISFDGSTATQALTKKGTFETFNNYTHPTTSGNKHIPSGGSSGQILRWSADGTATWGSDNNTWTAMVGATSSANGSVGYVNAVPPKDGYNTKYLRADGSWQVPPNTTYSAATTSAAGLMSASDKSKLNGIATGANKIGYVIKQINLSDDVTWSQSMSGMYYTSKVSIPEFSRVLGVTICGFYNLKGTDVVTPRIYGDGNYNGISFFGNTNTFSTGANIDIQVFGIV